MKTIRRMEISPIRRIFAPDGNRLGRNFCRLTVRPMKGAYLEFGPKENG